MGKLATTSNARSRRRGVDAAAVAAGYALDSAIIGLSPKRYWKCESALPFADYGTMNLPSTSSAGSFTVQSVAGGDGRNYLQLNNTGDIRGAFGANGAFPRAADATIVMLLKVDSVSGTKTIIDQSDGTWLRGQFLLGGSGQLYYVGADSGGLIYNFTANSYVTTGSWHMYAFRINAAGSTKTWYKDNSSSTASQVSDAAFADATSRFRLGASYIGGIAHVATWNSLLTATDLTTIYTAAQTDGWSI